MQLVLKSAGKTVETLFIDKMVTISFNGKIRCQLKQVGNWKVSENLFKLSSAVTPLYDFS